MHEKELKFERFRNPYIDITVNEKLISEMSRIGQKISIDNNIPFSAFDEIFKDSEKIAQIFNLLHFEKQNAKTVNRLKMSTLKTKKRIN